MKRGREGRLEGGGFEGEGGKGKSQRGNPTPYVLSSVLSFLVV